MDCFFEYLIDYFTRDWLKMVR